MTASHLAYHCLPYDKLRLFAASFTGRHIPKFVRIIPFNEYIGGLWCTWWPSDQIITVWCRHAICPDLVKPISSSVEYLGCPVHEGAIQSNRTFAAGARLGRSSGEVMQVPNWQNLCPPALKGSDLSDECCAVFKKVVIAPQFHLG